jgi:hypothetical protein
MRTPFAAAAFLCVGLALGGADVARADAPAGAPLDPVRVEVIRGDPALQSDPAVIEELAREADAAPPSMTRTNARLIVVSAWLAKPKADPAHFERALGILRALRDDPSVPDITARVAATQIVDELAHAGRVDEAVDEADTHLRLVDSDLVPRVHALARRRTLRQAAAAVFVLLAVLAGNALVRALLRGKAGDARTAVRRIAPIALAFSLYLGASGGLLASGYETGNASPFLWLALVVLPVAVVARAWSAVGSPQPAARAGRAIVCATAVLGAAFLLLDAVDPRYLEGFGL